MNRGDERYDRDHDRDRERERDRDYYHDNDTRDEPRYRQRESPGRGRDRYYRDYDDPRNRYNRSRSGAASPYDSADDDYYHDRRHRSGPGRPYHTIKLDGIPDKMSTQEVRWVVSCFSPRSCALARIYITDSIFL